MRYVKSCSLVAAVCVAFAVTAAGNSGLAAERTAVETTVPDGSDPRLPEGVYRTPELTWEQVIATLTAAGFTEEEVNAFFGTDPPDGTVSFGLRLANGGWTQLSSSNGGPDDVGWRGTYEVVDDDTVIATDPCGAITYEYAFDGEQLTLDMVDDQCVGAGGDTEVGELIAQTGIFETSPFTLVEPAGGDVAPAAPATYASTSFVVPFEVTLPGWVAPEPAIAESNFVTWEGTDADRGIRFLAPVNLYPPGSTTTTPLPDDYISYLLSQTDHGATFSDVVETTIDGLPATVVTATTDQSIDGGLGCQADGLAAEDCFGLQPDLSLRLAVVEVGDQPLLIWVRDIRGVDAEYDTFDAMLSSLHFGEPTDISDQPAASTSEAAENSAPEPTQATYASTTFAVPFEVTPPEWVPPGTAPSAERSHFLTWESSEPDRAVRFFVPGNVFPPGTNTATEVPGDYVSYLLTHADHGASIDDVVETTVDGRPATIVTATSPTFFEGSLGCEPEGECWGLIADAILRIAVIDVGDQTLLVWQRDPLDAEAVDYESFEAMLATLHLREDATPATEPAPAGVAAPIDGEWTTSLAYDELLNSPLLYDAGEVNNQNWGEFTFTFDNGRFNYTQHNPEAVWSMTGTYRIEDDVLYLDQDNGEHFVVRWHVDGDTLEFERDDSLGVAPTPFVVKPWTRQS